MLTSAQGASVQLHSKPFGKGVYAMLDVWGYGYWEMAQNSDHTPFRLAGIPTACFFSGNYKSAFFGYVQSSDLSKWTLNSNDDTLQNLLNNAADYAGKIQTVTQTVCNLVMDDGAVETVPNARQHLVDGLLFNVNFAKILGASLLVIAMVLGIIYDGKLKKQALLGVAEVKNNQQPTSNNVEDIFKF